MSVLYRLVSLDTKPIVIYYHYQRQILNSHLNLNYTLAEYRFEYILLLIELALHGYV